MTVNFQLFDLSVAILAQAFCFLRCLASTPDNMAQQDGGERLHANPPATTAEAEPSQAEPKAAPKSAPPQRVTEPKSGLSASQVGPEGSTAKVFIKDQQLLEALEKHSRETREAAEAVGKLPPSDGPADRIKSLSLRQFNQTAYKTPAAFDVGNYVIQDPAVAVNVGAVYVEGMRLAMRYAEEPHSGAPIVSDTVRQLMRANNPPTESQAPVMIRSHALGCIESQSGTGFDAMTGPVSITSRKGERVAERIFFVICKFEVQQWSYV